MCPTLAAAAALAEWEWKREREREREGFSRENGREGSEEVAARRSTFVPEIEREGAPERGEVMLGGERRDGSEEVVAW